MDKKFDAGKNNEDSKIKGKAFEDYIKNKIFMKENFDLLHQTHNYQENEDRFIDESANPDFKFKDRATGQIFWVEAKFRSKFNDEGKLAIFNFKQFKRYQECNSEETPVYIAIGYEGKASSPRNISLIPMKEIKYLDLYRSTLKKYDIEPNKSINFSEYLKQHDIKPVKNEIINQDLNQIKTNDDIAGIPKRNLPIRMKMAISLFLIIITVLGIYQSNKLIQKSKIQKKQEIIISKIEGYYNAVNNNKLDLLDEFINNKVNRYFNATNCDLAFIKRDAERYFKLKPYREIKYKWETLKVFKNQDGNYDVSFDMIYKIKAARHGVFSTYNLNIRTVWNQDMKLISIYELKIP
jgi:hypothetical protein